MKPVFQEVNSDLTYERDIVANEMIVLLGGTVEEVDMTVDWAESECCAKSYDIKKLSWIVFIHVD